MVCSLRVRGSLLVERPDIMTPLLFQFIYAVWVIWFAYLNKLWINSQSGFRHWANSISHICAAVFMWQHWHIKYSFALLFLVRAIFDGSLSLFRGLGFNYVSADPKSIIDRFEKRFFGMNGWLPKLIYLAICLLINLF
jgi:hypothetical protein